MPNYTNPVSLTYRNQQTSETITKELWRINNGTNGADRLHLGAEKTNRAVEELAAAINQLDTNISLLIESIQHIQRSIEIASVEETVSSTFTIPNDYRTIQRILLTGNATITLPSRSALVTGNQYHTLIVELKQDSTGNRSVTWATQGGDTLKWLASTTAHPINTDPNAISRVQFLFRGGESRIDAAVIWVD